MIKAGKEEFAIINMSIGPGFNSDDKEEFYFNTFFPKKNNPSCFCIKKILFLPSF